MSALGDALRNGVQVRIALDGTVRSRPDTPGIEDDARLVARFIRTGVVPTEASEFRAVLDALIGMTVREGLHHLTDDLADLRRTLARPVELTGAALKDAVREVFRGMVK